MPSVMEQKRGKPEYAEVVAVSLKLEPDLAADLDAHCEAHALRPSRSAVIKAALRDYLARQPGEVSE